MKKIRLDHLKTSLDEIKRLQRLESLRGVEDIVIKHIVLLIETGTSEAREELLAIEKVINEELTMTRENLLISALKNSLKGALSVAKFYLLWYYVSQAMNFLETKNLSKSFDQVLAVNQVNLSINQGISLGLVGESGSGKTTLSRLILGLIEPTSGHVLYNNVKDIRRELQIVFQDPQTSLNPRIRIGEAIAEPILIHQLWPKDKVLDKVVDLLTMVKLPADYGRRFPHELSGGERQRVGIARALATEPRLLILDEPVSALDVAIQVEILELLKQLKQELKLTYLFIAHDLSVIGFMCDQVAVMESGQIVELGSIETVLKTPQHPYTKKLLASVLWIPERIPKKYGKFGEMATPSRGFRPSFFGKPY